MAAFADRYACSTHIWNDLGGGDLSAFVKGFGCVTADLYAGFDGPMYAYMCGGFCVCMCVYVRVLRF